MMRKMENEALERDPAVADALRLVDREAPVDEVDWSALRSTIRSRAELPLARRRAAITAERSAWTQPLVPLAVAASIALALWVGVEVRDASLDSSPEVAAVAPRITAEEALAADISEQEFQLLVSGRANPDALLLIAANGE